ncbi:MAG TPA: glycosyltransferase 87 family protein [Gaiellaceae bacterium]|nr:glycosyltransferase 87 family protein [Gaiellaceae bacterium]
MSRRPAWPAGLGAAILFAFSFYVLQRWLEQGQLSDVGGYQQYAELIRHGGVPYRDFPFEYPPLALAPMYVASFMSWSYATSFAILMGICGAGCLALLASALRSVEAGPERVWAALLLFAVSPLVLGSLFDTRFDLWPALLALAAVAALVRERPLLSGALLGLGFAAKLWPGVLLPVAAIHLARRRGSSAALAAVAAFLVGAAACFLPFAVLAPHGLWSSVSGQLDRPLQVESLGAAILMAAQHLGMRPLATVTSHGAQALSGRGAGLAADLSTAAEVVAVLSVWVAYSRRRTRDREAALLAAAATVVSLVAFDKVLSPQYLIWLVPFVALAAGARGIVAAGLLLLALGLTQTWFPGSYWQLATGHESPWSWYLLARDLALVALAGVLGELQPRMRLRRRKSTFAGRSASLRMR